MTNTRIRYKRKIRIINFFAELIGSSIFSLLFFIFISRSLSPDFEYGEILLGLYIGAAYFAGVYIPFHTYRIHIIPFISIIRSLQKRKPSILYYKIPAQLIGSFLGTYVYHLFYRVIGEEINTVHMWSYEVSNLSDLIFFNALAVFILVYAFYIIQLLFKNMGFTSTFFFAIVIQVVFIFSCHVSELTALNVFGYFSLYLIDGNPGFSHSFLPLMLIHFIVPSLVSYGIYYYIRDRYIERSSKNTTNNQTA